MVYPFILTQIACKTLKYRSKKSCYYSFKTYHLLSAFNKPFRRGGSQSPPTVSVRSHGIISCVRSGKLHRCDYSSHFHFFKFQRNKSSYVVSIVQRIYFKPPEDNFVNILVKDLAALLVKRDLTDLEGVGVWGSVGIFRLTDCGGWVDEYTMLNSGWYPLPDYLVPDEECGQTGTCHQDGQGDAKLSG